jgi:CheY-like chemotaxis protein/HPt (histidine-containing phosphotransfer) domain-containing protein
MSYQNCYCITLLPTNIINVLSYQYSTLDDGANVQKDKFIGNVLVVDDNEVNQVLMSEFLDSLGIICDIASDGCMAADMFKAKPYDVVLMDLHMPKCDGLQGLKLIREYEGANNLEPHYIIALTADAISGKKEELLGAGFNAYLTKPIIHDELISVLSNVLQNSNIVVLEKRDLGLDNIVVPNIFNAQVAANELTLPLSSIIKSYRLFLKSANESMLGIQTAIENKDFITIRDLSHKIYGAAANLRIEKLADLAKWLEDNSKEENIIDIYEKANAMRDIFKQLN